MKRTISILLLLSIALIGLSFTAPAQVKLGPKDGADLPPSDLTRVKVGELAPDFTLEDQDARPVTLSSYRGQRSIVLVFYRGYW